MLYMLCLMIKFVNAKINIGLQVVNRREDGYHDLQTLFYPVGLYAGTPLNPTRFCDVLEISEVGADAFNSANPGGLPFAFYVSGRSVDCPIDKNLVWRAAKIYFEKYGFNGKYIDIKLEKHLPDGAGMGGGSADAAFTLLTLAQICGNNEDLSDLALSLGADCPFFLHNSAAYAEGVGEKLTPIDINLEGKWLAVVKPSVSISTREAFAGITPKPADFDLRKLPELPIEEWRNCVKNDFEDSIFPGHPEMKEVKQQFYLLGALYASLTGSGSCIYGIFEDEVSASKSLESLSMLPTISDSYLLKL